MDRRLMAFPVVEVAGVRVWVDQVRPVAVLQHADRPDRVVGWPGLFTGWAEPAKAVVPAPDGVWVHYGLLNSVDDDSALAALVDDVDAPAVHIGAATGRASVVRVGRDLVLGASRHGLWTTATIAPDPDPGAPYDGGPLPEGWSHNTTITVHRPDGSRLQTVVDRSVLAVAEIEDRVRVLVHASPAIAVPSGHGSTSYTYRPTELTLPAGQPLPAQIRFRELVPDGWGIPAELTRTMWPQRSTMVPPVTGPASAADVEWQLVELPVEAQHHAVEYTVRQFANLEQYWRPEGGASASPLSDGLHDSKVTTSGDYPDTQVEVSFRHPAYPQGRLRRVYDVYDSAGRIRVDPHLAIWLMEDLDTGALPASDTAIDGVLTI